VTILKKTTLIVLTVALVIILAGCSSQSSEKLLTSEDYPYTRAIISTDVSTFDITVVSYEFVTQDMVRIIGEKRSEIGDEIRITDYDFLVDKSNVTFVNITREEN